MVTAEGWVVLGRGGGRGQVQPAGAAPAFPDQQEDGRKGCYREQVDDSGLMEQQLAMRRQMMYRGIATPQWVGTIGNQGIGGKWGQRQEI